MDGWMLRLPSFSPIAAIDKSAVGHRKLLLGALKHFGPGVLVVPH